MANGHTFMHGANCSSVFWALTTLTHPHTDGAPFRSDVRFSILLKDIWGSNRDHLISGWPTLPPEPQPPDKKAQRSLTEVVLYLHDIILWSAFSRGVVLTATSKPNFKCKSGQVALQRLARGSILTRQHLKKRRMDFKVELKLITDCQKMHH